VLAKVDGSLVYVSFRVDDGSTQQIVVTYNEERTPMSRETRIVSVAGIELDWS
jgi:hypothetical protein